jgi:quercetin dioxygenase-like cupin family protein
MEGQEPRSVQRILREPTVVRRAEATRFLWGDEESGQVSDLVYGRGERISAVTFSLGPGHWFGTSDTWKPLYDQHRYYFVVEGALAILDPESGEMAVAGAGEAVTWRGSRFHHGYSVGDAETVVLDWFAPPERALGVPEIAVMGAKRDLKEVQGGRYELLGAWPDKCLDEQRRRAEQGGIVSVGPRSALHLVHGERNPLLVSILSSSEIMTGGTFALRASSKSEPEEHPGDEVVFCLSGRLHIRLPMSGDWFELQPFDCAYLPEGTPHEYWSYGAKTTKAAFCVSPRYR